MKPRKGGEAGTARGAKGALRTSPGRRKEKAAARDANGGGAELSGTGASNNARNRARATGTQARALVDTEQLQEAERLAAQGLTLEQIAIELGWPEPLRPSLRVRAEAAMRRGRAIGSAALKRAHYEAALNGSISAQKDMLALLTDEEDSDEPVEVERVILDGPTSSQEAKD